MVLEADRVAEGASGRNGGFCAASLTHGLHNGLLPLPRRARTSSRRRALATCASSSRSSATRGSTRSSRRQARSTSRRSRGRSRGSRSTSTWPPRTASSSRSWTARRSRREVHSPRFQAGVRGGPERCVMVNPAKLAWGLATAAERRGARIAEGSRVRRLERRAGRVEVQVEGGGIVEAEHVHRRDVRVQRLDAAPREHVRAGLRLRADDRAAHRRPAGRDRLGRPRGHVGRGQPVPLLPPIGRRPDPVGRVRRDLPPGQRGQAGTRPAAGDVRRCWRGSSSRRSPSSTGSGSRTAGAARSTPRPGSGSRSGRRWAGGSTTRWATRGSASARPAGRPACCATWFSSRTPTCSGSGSSARVRSRSRRSLPGRPRSRSCAVGHRRGLERGPARAVPPGDGRPGDRLRLLGVARSPPRGGPASVSPTSSGCRCFDRHPNDA